MKQQEKDLTHIVIIGGGFAGLEAALYLRRRLGQRARITVVSEQDAFTFRPHLIYVPFGMEPDQARLDLRTLALSKGIDFLAERVEGIQPEHKQVMLTSGPLAYDFLMIATGTGLAPSGVPGLERVGYAIWREADLLLLRNTFERLRYADSPSPWQVVFLVPPESQWAGPLYEMAFMLAQWLEWGEARAASSIRFLTHEHVFMQALGEHLHETLAQEFERHGIEAETNRPVTQVEAPRLIFESGEPADFDLLIVAPTYQAPVTWKPLPSDARGFLQTVFETRQVQDWPDIYAIGDVSDYPIKQAFLALLQADAAAEHLAARLLDTDPDFVFEPESLWVMEQFDQTLFANVPLGTPEAMAVAEDRAESHVRIIPPGLLQRLALRKHLSLQDRFSHPLYAGLLWKGLRTGMGLLPYLMKQEDS